MKRSILAGTVTTILILAVTIGLLVELRGSNYSEVQLRSAPEVLALSARLLVIDTSFSRDFMPIAEANGSPLMGNIMVKTTDGAALPAGLKVRRVWVINGSEV